MSVIEKMAPLSLFVMNMMIVAMGIPAMIPLVVPASMKMQCYTTCIMIAVVANLSRVFRKSPPLPKPITSFDAWKLWFVPFTMDADFHQLFFAAIFLSGRPQLVAVIPLGSRAMLLAMAYANKNYSNHFLWLNYGKKAYSYVESNLMKLMQVVAMMEVSLGFLLVLDGFVSSGKGLMRAFMYWHWLKLKFKYERYKFAGNSNLAYKQYHTIVWYQLHEAIAVPVVRRLPIVQKAIDMVSRWFAM